MKDKKTTFWGALLAGASIAQTMTPTKYAWIATAVQAVAAGMLGLSAKDGEVKPTP